MTAPLRIDNRTARHLWLDAQGLAATPTGKLDLLGTIKKLGFVQLDSIQIVARAQHHILWSRNQNYREKMLDRLLARDRGVFEHFTHDASAIPMDFLPMWQRQFTRKADELIRKGWAGKMSPEDRAAIKDRIRAEGALSTQAFDTKRDDPGAMWSRPPHKLALDYMWFAGELATCHRKGFTKVYDLAERVFGCDPCQSDLTDAEQIDWLNRAALSRMGFGSAGDIQRFWDAVGSDEVRVWLEDHGSDLVPVEIETAARGRVQAVAPPDIEERIAGLDAPTTRLRILNPFDPVIRDRARLERLFGFDYRVEMFVPEAKRKWGYYIFPILEGARFVGRCEIKADRKAGTLTVKKIWAEPRVRWTPARAAKFEAEVDRMRRFVGVGEVIWDTEAPLPV